MPDMGPTPQSFRFNRSESGIPGYAFLELRQGPQSEKYLSAFSCPRRGSTFKGKKKLRDSPVGSAALYKGGEEIIQRPVFLK